MQPKKESHVLKCSHLCLLYVLSSFITLWCAEQDVDSAGPVDLVLLGNDDGKGSAGSTYILQCLG